jgi:capsid assembly protease
MNANQLWLMEPNKLLEMRNGMAGLSRPTTAQIEEHRQAAAAAMRKVSGKVAVVPVYGVIEQKGSEYSYYYGGTSTEILGQTLDRLSISREVEAVVLDVDSPGGTTDGIIGLADKLYNLRASKPCYAIANSMAASAAYWIASQCTQLVCDPGGDVGSIGVYSMHADMSKALEAAGVSVSIIKAGKYKAEGNPYEPLDDEARSNLQSTIDAWYAKFCEAVARGRGVKASEVRSAKWGQGRCLMAEDALAAGLVDKMMTMDDLLGKLGGSPVDGRAMRSARLMRLMRLRWQQQKAKGQ